MRSIHQSHETEMKVYIPTHVHTSLRLVTLINDNENSHFCRELEVDTKQKQTID